MAPKKNLVRTVAYWRLVNAVDHCPVEHFDWPTLLAKWASDGPVRVSWDGDDYTGTVYPLNEIDGLILAKGKDFVPNEADASGKQHTMRSRGDDWDPVDNLFVHFLPFGNVIAIVRESNSAPAAGTLARWLTRSKVFQKQEWGADVIIDPGRRERLQGKEGVKELFVATRASSLPAEHGGALRRLRGLRDFGDVEVEITIKAKGKERRAEQSDLLDVANEVISGLDLTKGYAKTTATDSEGAETIDFLKHRITRRRQIHLPSGHDRSLQAKDAFEVLQTASGDDENLLRQVTGQTKN